LVATVAEATEATTPVVEATEATTTAVEATAVIPEKHAKKICDETLETS